VTLPLTAGTDIDRDKSLVDAALRSGLSFGRQTAANTYWNIWSNFRLQYHLDPYVAQGPNAVYWLQIFAVRVRMGWLSASGNPVRADMVADALAHVGTAHTMANQRDPRHVPGTTTIRPPTPSNPQRFSQTRLGTIPRHTHPSPSPSSRLGHHPTAKHGAFDQCHGPNLVGFLFPAPSWRIHHHRDGTTPVYPCRRPPLAPRHSH
jgi:hypothetical protein